MTIEVQNSRQLVVFDYTKQIVSTTIDKFSVAFSMPETKLWLVEHAGKQVAGLFEADKMLAWQKSVVKASSKPVVASTSRNSLNGLGAGAAAAAYGAYQVSKDLASGSLHWQIQELLWSV